MQLRIPADAEQALIDEFSPLYTIATKIPLNQPNEFVRVVAAGGNSRDLVSDTRLLTIESFAVLSETRALFIINDLLARLDALIQTTGKVGFETVYSIAYSALPQNMPLASLPTHFRYLATVQLTLRRRLATA